MAQVELHDYTFEQDPGIVVRAGQINFVFVDDEAIFTYNKDDGSVELIKSVVDNSVIAAIYSIASNMKKDGLSANFFIFNDPLVAQKFIADNDAKLTLVISDNNMPNVSGFDMIRNLREQGVAVQAIIRSGLSTDVPPGVETADKLMGPKVLYQERIVPKLVAGGHFNPSGNNAGIEQVAKPSP